MKKRMIIKVNRSKGETKIANQIMNIVNFLSLRYGVIIHLSVTQIADDFIEDKISFIFEFKETI